MPAVYSLLFTGLLFLIVLYYFKNYKHRALVKRVCSRNPDSDYCRQFFQNSSVKYQGLNRTRETYYGKKPGGGCKTVCYYADSENRPVKKRQAQKVVLLEFDSNNRVLCETWSPMEYKCELITTDS